MASPVSENSMFPFDVILFIRSMDPMYTTLLGFRLPGVLTSDTAYASDNTLLATTYFRWPAIFPNSSYLNSSNVRSEGLPRVPFSAILLVFVVDTVGTKIIADELSQIDEKYTSIQWRQFNSTMANRSLYCYCFGSGQYPTGRHTKEDVTPEFF